MYEGFKGVLKEAFNEGLDYDHNKEEDFNKWYESLVIHDCNFNIIKVEIGENVYYL